MIIVNRYVTKNTNDGTHTTYQFAVIKSQHFKMMSVNCSSDVNTANKTNNECLIMLTPYISNT